VSHYRRRPRQTPVDEVNRRHHDTLTGCKSPDQEGRKHGTPIARRWRQPARG
jgi:hypothetical protein